VAALDLASGLWRPSPIRTDKVDMVVRKSDEYRRTEFSRRRPVSLDDHAFFIVAPEDLVISKLEWRDRLVRRSS
jgi:hypothetical protein